MEGRGLIPAKSGLGCPFLPLTLVHSRNPRLAKVRPASSLKLPTDPVSRRDLVSGQSSVIVKKLEGRRTCSVSNGRCRLSILERCDFG
jgi:hypothetical protein